MKPTQQESVDPIGALAQPRLEVGWIVPGPAQLVLGGTSMQPTDETPIEVDVLEERGSEVRVGVRLDHARFALWIARSRMLGVLGRELAISPSPTPQVASDASPQVRLRAGARVDRLARKEGFTQIRYIGSLEVEGWVPDDAVGERGPADRSAVRRDPGRKSLMITPGGTIRFEKRWSSRGLAVARRSVFFETVEVLDDGWSRVAYADTDVTVTGFYSKRDPPSRTHRVREPEAVPPVITNLTVPADTCLFAGDEPVGFVVGDRPALVEPSPRVGWYALTLDTPWGPVGFEASGPTESTLAKCPSPTP